MKTTACLLVALVLLSGCMSQRAQSDKTTAAEIDNQHIHFDCGIKIDANGGLRADLAGPCEGKLRSGAEPKESWSWTGMTGNLGSAGENRESRVTGFIVYPDGHNGATQTQKYNSDNKETHEARLSLKIPTEGLGKYQLCLSFYGLQDGNKWWPGVQEKPDQTTPLPKCVTFNANRSWF